MKYKGADAMFVREGIYFIGPKLEAQTLEVLVELVLSHSLQHKVPG